VHPLRTHGTRHPGLQPAHITRRIVAQSGWFSVHKYLQQGNKFLPLNQNINFSKKLERYIVPRRQFSEIRKELNNLGINRFTLFPELPALSQVIEEQFLGT